MGKRERSPGAEPELTHDEIRRYSRHLILDDVRVQGQRKLKAGKVLCIGGGGLGSPALMYLAAAGVGRVWGLCHHASTRPTPRNTP